MVWVKITTSLRVGDLCRHGYSNNHAVKIREQSWSRFEENHNDCRYETANKQASLVLNPTFC